MGRPPLRRSGMVAADGSCGERRSVRGARRSPELRISLVCLPADVTMGTRLVASLGSVTKGDTFVAVSWQWFQEGRVSCTAVIAWPCLVSGGVVGLALCRPVLLVVSASVFTRFHSPVLGCQSVVALASVVSRPGGVSRVQGGSSCVPSILWRSEVAVLEVRD
ncbi:hypothetical protein Taro_035954 [Colocasia esculenta]|uniref:Uncharacterized protein n=1 Tax=Colocasia esculenta TaxID=4460 RepID=A0A843WK78_COLES|nr:hypothetical protein [Colocasia esculenta]